MYQKTIKERVTVEGKGLHSGNFCRLRLEPAPPNTGISFYKEVAGEVVQIDAVAQNVVGTRYATTIGLIDHPESSIATIEHLMAALYGLGIDNIDCHVFGPEIPLLDGCSREFVDCLKSAGIHELAEPKKLLKVRDTVCCAEGDAWAVLKPHSSFRLNVQIAYEHTSFKDPMVCHASFDEAVHSFVDEISAARTYGFRSDHSYLRSEGLAQGAEEGMHNILIFEHERLHRETKLRYPNEAARHKILDAYGDLALTGYGGILGSYTGYKAGHTLNNRLVRKLLSHPNLFEEAHFSDAA